MSAESLREQIAKAVASTRGPGRVRATDRLIADRVLAVLGEVTVTEEWGCRLRDCACGRSRHRRTVVTCVGEWEVAE